MFNVLHFIEDEEGAVTVDWVVLTAAVVGFSIAIANVIDMNTTALSGAAAGAIAGQNDGFGAGE